MEDSILTSTKAVLGLAADYTAFDLDILTHINAAMSTLVQVGAGSDEDFLVEDETKTWQDLAIPQKQLNMVRSYVYLKVRMLFDPPGTSYLIEAFNNQIQQFEWRLNVFYEGDLMALEEEEEVV